MSDLSKSSLVVCRDLVSDYVLDEFFSWLPSQISYIEWVWRYDPGRRRPVYLGSRVLDFDDDPVCLDLAGWKDAAFEIVRQTHPAAKNHPNLLRYLRAGMAESGCEVIRIGYQVEDYEEDEEDED